MITITTLKQVPPFAQGLVRDLRVRWALEEAGLEYETRLIEIGDDQASPDYRKKQPFGQVPVFEQDGFTLFESGAIVLHIGTRSQALLPADETRKARAIAWMFSALDTIETAIRPLIETDIFHPGEGWAQQRRPDAESGVRRRLQELAAWLGERDYLEDRFTAGDLMMTSALRELRHSDLVAAEPNLKAYQERCEARPAFQRALRDHMDVYEKHPWTSNE